MRIFFSSLMMIMASQGADQIVSLFKESLPSDILHIINSHFVEKELTYLDESPLDSAMLAIYLKEQLIERFERPITVFRQQYPPYVISSRSDNELNLAKKWHLACRINVSEVDFLKKKGDWDFVERITLCHPVTLKIMSFPKSNQEPTPFDPLKGESVLGIYYRLALREDRFMLKTLLNKNSQITSLVIKYSVGKSNLSAHTLDILRDNTTIQSLCLRDNLLGCYSGEYFSKFLGLNTSVTSLDLSGNVMGNLGVKNLGEGLEFNKTLKILMLDHNFLDEQGALAFIQKIQFNCTLSLISFVGNQISEDVKSYIQKIRPNNYLF